MPRMARLTLTACALLITFLAPPVSAYAAGPTVAEALVIADAYWGEHPCAGRVHVIENAAVVAERGNLGEASGMVPTWDGATWQWRVDRCEVSIAPESSAAVRCVAIVHEVGHLKNGPGHEGLMDPSALFVNDCMPDVVTPREGLIRDIHDELPQGMSWRVTCSPYAHRMRCRASSQRARYARLYVAAVERDEVTFHLARLKRR